MQARNSSRHSQAKWIVRSVVIWREFRGGEKIATTLICYARLTQYSKPVENRKNPVFIIYSSRFSGRNWTVVCRGYFSHDSSHSENVASARRVLFTRSSLKLLEFVKSFRRSITICSAQFSHLQYVSRNRKTILSLTIICHSISVFLAHVRKIEPRSADLNLKKKLIYWVYLFVKFSFLANQQQNWWKRAKTRLTFVSHAFSL